MPKKILLADDSITIQKVVELTFSDGDYQVISVGNGAQALEMISQLRPDVALLDVIMPEVNGYEVCEKIKTDPATAAIPVLLLTGTFEPFDRKRAEAAGANGHLTKPFESQMLITRVSELITASVPARAEGVPEANRVEKTYSPEPSLPEQSFREEDPFLADAKQDEKELEGTEEPSPVPERVRAAGIPPERPGQGGKPTSGSHEKSVGQEIIPDRFDEQENRRPSPGDASEGVEGVRTIRVSTDEAVLSSSVPVETAASESSQRDREAEAWDELASGLAATPPTFRDEPMGPRTPLGSEAGRMGEAVFPNPDPSQTTSIGSAPAPAEDTEAPLRPVMADSPPLGPLPASARRMWNGSPPWSWNSYRTMSFERSPGKSSPSWPRL